MTRIGLSALVTMTVTKSAVVTLPIGMSSSVAVPAFTNNASNDLSASRSRRRRNLIRLVDVEHLDLDPAGVGVGKLVQLRARRPTHGADDVPAARQELGGDGVPEATRCADDEESGAVRG